jgi:transcriptional regulator GlxA family with amidase domain
MKNVGIFLFENIELLDFAGPFEVFSVTNELNNFKLFNTFTVTRNENPVRSVNGLKIIPDYSIENSPKIDILIIPGGVGTKALLPDKSLLDWIFSQYQQSEITFSVCSGARVLAKLGLLDNAEFITHHEVIGDVLEIAPKAIVNKDRRFIDNGKLMTSAGISAGIDLSLYIVEKICGKEIRNKTVQYMEYGDWESL